MNEAVFRSPEQAIETLWKFTARMTALIAWTWIALLHLLGLVLLLAWAWAVELRAADVATAVLQASQSRHAAVLGLLGLSAATLLGLYLWALRRLHRWLGNGPFLDYLMATVRPRDGEGR